MEGGRHLLLAVGEMHRTGFQLVRIVPGLADSAGGGRWVCWLVPAGLTSAGHGADHVRWPPPMEDPFPYFPVGHQWQSVPLPATPQETAATVLRLYPQLAAAGRGTDAAYARWYAEMLRLTEPHGMVIARHYADGLDPPPADRLRVLNDPGRAESVPPPPIAVGAGAGPSPWVPPAPQRPWWRFWR
jgi:hypothetical protein